MHFDNSSSPYASCAVQEMKSILKTKFMPSGPSSHRVSFCSKVAVTNGMLWRAYLSGHSHTVVSHSSCDSVRKGLFSPLTDPPHPCCECSSSPVLLVRPAPHPLCSSPTLPPIHSLPFLSNSPSPSRGGRQRQSSIELSEILLPLSSYAAVLFSFIKRENWAQPF